VLTNKGFSSPNNVKITSFETPNAVKKVVKQIFRARSIFN
jgi:hypothetical protein